jgi:hypothetical protein
MDGKKMSFAARIVDDASHPLRNDIDGNRHFVLTFYVVDGTLGIYEPMQKNSGLAGRKYLERICHAAILPDAGGVPTVNFHAPPRATGPCRGQLQ